MNNSVSIFILVTICILPLSQLNAQELNKAFTSNHGFKIKLNESWEEIPKETLNVFIEENKKINENSVNWDYAYQYTKDEQLLFDHYILVKAYETGRVSKEGFLPFKKTKDEINDQLKRENNNIEVLEHAFNNDTKTRHFVSKIIVPQKGNIISVSSFLFTEKGYIEIHCYCKNTESEIYIPYYKEVIKNIELNEHIKYRDRIAELLPIGLKKTLRPIFNAVIGATFGLGIIAAFSYFLRKKRMKANQ
jgi:hypothetical protein